MVTVSIEEMYDMATSLNKIGIIGIHTPNLGQIARRWAGLMINHKFLRVKSCDVHLACASMLPADPLQIGTTTGTIAPQDMMNPLLYRAVSNESWNAFTSRLFATSGASVNQNSVKVFTEEFSSQSDDNNEKIYYNALSEPGWKKAFPQSGLDINGLKPLVYPILTQFGNGEAGINNYGLLGSGSQATTPAGNPTTVTNPTTGTAQLDNARYFRGRAQPMPRFPTSYPYVSTDSTSVVGDTWTLMFQDSYQIPRTYVACILTPPGKLVKFYYRLRIVWHIEFSDMCTATERVVGNSMVTAGNYAYSRQYTIPEAVSSKLSEDSALVTDSDLVSEDDDNSATAVNMVLDKVMEK